MDIKNKFKARWYWATDHRHGTTWLQWMSIATIPVLLFAAKELYDEQPQLLVYILAATAVSCLAFFVYCMVGEGLFHLRVRREQGETKVHDLS